MLRGISAYQFLSSLPIGNYFSYEHANRNSGSSSTPTERIEIPDDDNDDYPLEGRTHHNVGYGHAFEEERNVWS